MTTKKELREALQRLLDATDASAERSPNGQAERIGARVAARAILARPAVVVGYRVRGMIGYEPRILTTWRPDDEYSLAECRAHCVAVAKRRKAQLYRLVAR